MKFFARFSNIYLEVNLSMIYSFLKEIKETYKYRWVRKLDHRVLTIYGDQVYELPFQEKEHKVFLSINELTTNEKSFALSLNQLLFKAKKRQMEILSIKDKHASKTKKVYHDQLMVEDFKNKHDHKNVIPPSNHIELTEYAIQSEIDYLLMDLYEAMQVQDQDKMSWCKSKLEEMTRLKSRRKYKN